MSTQKSRNQPLKQLVSGAAGHCPKTEPLDDSQIQKQQVFLNHAYMASESEANCPSSSLAFLWVPTFCCQVHKLLMSHLLNPRASTVVCRRKCGVRQTVGGELLLATAIWR